MVWMRKTIWITLSNEASSSFLQALKRMRDIEVAKGIQDNIEDHHESSKDNRDPEDLN